MLYLKKYIFIILTITILISCLVEENINLPFNGYQPQNLNDGWIVSNPTDEGMNAEKINEVYSKVYDEDYYPTVHSLLIVRNGRLIAEGYTKDKSERGIPHNIVSATKSISSILTGIAIDKGFINSVNNTVFEYLPEYFDDDLRKRAINLHHVLTMETGLNFDNDVHTNEMFNYKGSSLEFVLHKKLLFLPGEEWYYGDGNPQLISGIIEVVTGKSEEKFAEQYLFGALGIENYHWEKHADGLNYGAKGLWLLPRDMAKIGQLMVQQGSWQGKQIVSPEWIHISTGVQSENQNYGYYWYPDVRFKAYYAEGHGGQVIWIGPEQQLVIVFTADSYAKSYNLLSKSYTPLINGIIESIIN